MQDNFSDIKPRGLDRPKSKFKFITKTKGVTMIGVEETKEAAVAIAALSQAVVNSLDNDGKITLLDAGNFVAIIPEVIAGVTGVDQIPAELADLDPVEKEAVLAAVKERLDVDVNVETFVDQCLRTAYDLKQCIDYFKAINPAPAA